MPFNLGRVRRSFFGGARYFFPQLSNLFFRFDSLLVSVLAYALLVHTVCYFFPQRYHLYQKSCSYARLVPYTHIS
jgi:hypothetical protein